MPAPLSPQRRSWNPLAAKMSRRSFLSAMGTGCGVLLLDLCARDLVSEARAASTQPPRRFIVLVNGNGLHAERYRTVVRSETDFDLPAILQPLEPYRQDLLVVQPLYNPHNREFHGNGWATLSVMPSPRTGGDEFGPFYGLPSGISLDRFLARTIGAQTPFSSINLGLLEQNDSVPHVSSDGPGQAFPAERSPVAAYLRLFGSLLPSSGVPPEHLLAQNRSLLDLVQDDVRRTLRRLSGMERAKLEQYLESLRALEQRLARLGPLTKACSVHAAPEGRLDTLQTSRGPVRPEVIRAHLDVACNALQCGLTRVVAVSIHGNAAAHNRYDFLGDTRGHHMLCHEDNKEMLAKIDTFIASQLAYIWGRLRAVPEAGGTMADSTLVLWMNSGGGQHHNGWDNHAAVILGRLGGALRAGRYLTYPAGAHCVSDLFVSLANALGVSIRSFGDPVHCKGPLPGLS
ncbi:MAG: DUF1552 domain-containing protein [Myxococcales bacterium]|nr:DUF1552 domain-containing protein [Myxococcota bacterium]MDW8281814.1 DUF1552 domain-containing protein [Myxococcales bacterium]